ncbi:hypoxanthine-guanine phosphoribosyltransferase [Opitutaceae bacterium TAV1]|nr:hypoxanthine-guanine phosphoribosyltransferase [Opitutaceae bacterium TAV1]
MQLPAHVDLLYTSSRIDARLGELAGTLDAWAAGSQAETGRMLVAVCVLRGGVFFFSDLLLRMRASVEPGFCRAWSYAKNRNGEPGETVRMEWLGLDVKDRDVVLVDNICDSGRTLGVASEWLRGRGARTVRTAVIVHRLRPDSQHTPTLAGFVYAGSEWLVGYGLRDREAGMMNTRVICSLRPEPAPPLPARNPPG